MRHHSSVHIPFKWVVQSKSTEPGVRASCTGKAMANMYVCLFTVLRTNGGPADKLLFMYNYPLEIQQNTYHNTDCDIT